MFLNFCGNPITYEADDYMKYESLFVIVLLISNKIWKCHLLQILGTTLKFLEIIIADRYVNKNVIYFRKHFTF